MKVYGLQFDIVWENKAANHAKVLKLIEATRPEPGALVVLSEMFATGFTMNVDASDDSETQETQQFLSRTAAEYRVYLLGGVVTRDDGGRGRNQCVVYDPEGRELARYHKLRPFTLGGEADNYSAGKKLSLFKCGEFTVAPYICYDLRFPEIFRPAASQGANLYTVIASWPMARVDHWVTLLKARAIENQAYVIGVNRCGTDPMFSFTGRSMIYGPGGQVLADAGSSEGVMVAELNLDELIEYRRQLPFLEDMHQDDL